MYEKDRPSTPLLTPAAIVRQGGQFEVTIQGVQVSVETSKANAITVLCKEAIRRKETLVTTVAEGAQRNYLTMTANGRVSPSAAPAPGSLKPDMSAPRKEGLGPGARNEDTTRAWVEENLLTAAVEPPKKKRWFGRG